MSNQFILANGEIERVGELPRWVSLAADAFAAGAISAGKLAELLGCTDKHGFKIQAHSFCDADQSAARTALLEAAEAIGLSYDLENSTGAHIAWWLEQRAKEHP